MQSLVTKIQAYLESKKQEQLHLLIQICNQNSYSFNRDGANKVANMILENLNSILPIHEVDLQQKFADHHILRTNRQKKNIYLVGHIDTVFPPDHPFQSCHIKNDILYGPGTGDMKGGLTVIIYALKALHHIGFLHDLPISIIFNSDEEAGSQTSFALFERERQNALICLVAECAGLKNEIVISRNGKLGARIKSYGKARHVGSGTHHKSSAILEMAHKIIALEALNNAVPDFSLNVGKMEGGLGPATVPSLASCYIDMRWKEEGHKNIILEKIQNILIKNSQPQCYSEIEILNSRPTMPFTGVSSEIIALMQQTGKDHDQKIPTEHRRGSSDANFFGSIDIPTLDGLGPISGNDHTENEYIKISSLYERTILLSIFILKYLKIVQ